MHKRIMILGASILQLPAIEKALEMGLQVVGVDMNPEAIGLQVEGVIPEIISTIDIPAVVEAAKRHKIDGVMTLASDMPMRTVAAVAKELDLIGITSDTALRVTNKAEMRKVLKEHNVSIPEFYKVSNEVEYEKAILSLQFPIIVKPADNSGSRGIFKLESGEDIELIQAAYKYSKEFSRNGDVVVEEWMEGPEVSVETLTIDGTCHVIQITDKITTGSPHFVEMGHTQPTRLSDSTSEQIKIVAKSANKALGITNGPSHTEIIVTKSGPKIVELGARLGGDCITTHLVTLSTGVNMVECCIRIALGEKPDITPKFAKGSAIRYFKQTAGVIKNIYGVEDANHMEGIQQVSITHDIGETITQIDSSTARMGFVIAQGDSAEEAARMCNGAMSKIKVEME
ncbi:ATP-grasp domain-containing protein [Enterococcus faecium]|uniref:ATP-grasp domain-containing protein n=1 Tax=Enterococcus TaxID=1350 RepID=UPI000CF21571|nr:ATP-grasp domain-containing protein [Enterococcus faecium]EMF0554452.1 ATP-grasp domain-containing protein [Enterococcus faecium]PQD87014.1 lactate dehydrogenase [Enterococcus faecium]